MADHLNKYKKHYIGGFFAFLVTLIIFILFIQASATFKDGALDADGDEKTDTVSSTVQAMQVDPLTVRYRSLRSAGSIELSSYLLTLEAGSVVEIERPSASSLPQNLVLKSLSGDIEVQDTQDNQIFGATLSNNDSLLVDFNSDSGTATLEGTRGSIDWVVIELRNNNAVFDGTLEPGQALELSHNPDTGEARAGTVNSNIKSINTKGFGKIESDPADPFLAAGVTIDGTVDSQGFVTITNSTPATGNGGTTDTFDFSLSDGSGALVAKSIHVPSGAAFTAGVNPSTAAGQYGQVKGEGWIQFFDGGGEIMAKTDIEDNATVWSTKINGSKNEISLDDAAVLPQFINYIDIGTSESEIREIEIKGMGDSITIGGGEVNGNPGTEIEVLNSGRNGIDVFLPNQFDEEADPVGRVGGLTTGDGVTVAAIAVPQYGDYQIKAKVPASKPSISLDLLATDADATVELADGGQGEYVLVGGVILDAIYAPLDGNSSFECTSATTPDGDNCFSFRFEDERGNLVPSNLRLIDSAGNETLVSNGLTAAAEFGSSELDGTSVSGQTVLILAPNGRLLEDPNGVTTTLGSTGGEDESGSADVDEREEERQEG